MAHKDSKNLSLYAVDVAGWGRGGNFTVLLELSAPAAEAASRKNELLLNSGCCLRDHCIICVLRGIRCDLSSLRPVPESQQVCEALSRWQRADLKAIAERLAAQL